MKAYNYLGSKLRQFCWAHLLRDFQAMVDRGGECQRIGSQLLQVGRDVIHYWHRIRDGTITPEWYRAQMAICRRQINALLLEGLQCAGPKTYATCKELLLAEDSLWTFVHHPGVEPTNNRAERALRRGVLWRKTSFGTQSDRGSRFVERMLTTVVTLRQQKRNILEFLTQAVLAHQQNLPPPSLLPQAQL